MPNSWFITCKASIYNFQANIGQVFSSDYLKMNDAFNVLRTGGPLALAPFSEYASFSNSYRVINFRCKTIWNNNEAFSLLVITVPSIFTLGTNNSLILDFSTNQYGQKRNLSAKTGQDRVAMHTNIHLPTYFGSVQYMNDPNYAAAVSTDPATLLYYNYGAFSTNNQLLGIEYTHLVEMDVLFYRKDMFIS